ncbi:MAG: hypothetical protein JXR94_04910, partial [Candidatus Hydrogenedentes bacterium]|nr:hypothetical protein [Candidatus Hydrogenedentota bacterium]
MNRFTLCLVVCCAVQAGSPADEVLGIPYKPDPPLAVDGDLADWREVPNAMALTSPEQVVWGAANWESPEDLSATVRTAWRGECLFIAAEVEDDNLRQTQRGANIWRGDHVEVYVDVCPDVEGERDTYGEGQFQLAFSPGNFLDTGDALTDCPPEAFCFVPVGKAVEGVAVGAERSGTGWRIEAAVPWEFLGLAGAKEGVIVRIELAVSDTDTAEPQQESMMTTSPAPWARSRSRLRLAGLAGSDGIPPEVVRSVPVFDEVRLDQGQVHSFPFACPAVPEGHLGVLCIEARLDHPRVAGYHPGMRLALNGEPLAGERLLNKPLRVKTRSGRVFSMYAGDRLATYYSPDYVKPDYDAHYALMDNVKPCAFELRVGDLLREGENTLEIRNACEESVT